MGLLLVKNRHNSELDPFKMGGEREITLDNHLSSHLYETY